MRLGLADLKKSVTTRNGERYLAPYLLRPRERTEALAALIALHEEWLGRSRRDFPLDRPAELIGDYQLARCLLLTLGEWYAWESPQWPGGATEAEAASLTAQGISSSGQLRLALYDAVNQLGGGYLAASEREAQLDAFADTLGVTRATLDTLLTHDADECALLRRVAERAPTARELAGRYNQRAVETLLANASVVEWTIPPEASESSGGGLGFVLKRICFLARRMGVLYDVAFDGPLPAPDLPDIPHNQPDQRQALRVAERQSPYFTEFSPPPARAPGIDASHPHPLRTPNGYPLPTLNAVGLPLVVTLYGPQEVMGAPNQYGERLARLCRALLGYGRNLTSDPHLPTGQGEVEKTAKPQAPLAGAGLSGAARVYLYGRPMTFALDDRLLALTHLAALPEDAYEDAYEDATDETPSGAGNVAFDSSLERLLYADFTALERAGEAAGWRIEREPEPLLIGATILIPDFALTRGARRVYLEIAGYWRPGYRERKARKLAALRGAAALIVAAPESAGAEFAGLDADFPFVWYRNTVSAPALLATLERAYNDFSARLAALDLPRILAEITLRGRIPPTESMALLHCYTRAELAEAVQTLAQAAIAQDQTPPVWLDGIGLCAARWQEATSAQVLAILRAAPDGRLSLDELRRRLNDAEPRLGDLTDAATETLAAAAGVLLVRASIFAVDVLAPEQTELAQALQAEAQTATESRSRRRVSKSAVGASNKGSTGDTAAQPRAGVRRKDFETHTATSAGNTGRTDNERDAGDSADTPLAMPTLFPPDAR